MDRRFPAELHFYKKGCSCYTKLYGIATIITEERKRRMVTIKFKINNAECFYNNSKAPSTLVKLANTVCYFIKSFYRDGPSYLNIALNNAS